MIHFAMTPHKVALEELNERSKDYEKYRIFVDLRNSIPVFFDEEKVKLLLKDPEAAILSFVESSLRFMEYCMKYLDKPIEFNFFYEVGRSEYHKKLNKNYKSNRRGSYLILTPNEVEKADQLNIICFEALKATLQYSPDTYVYKVNYFEADFIPHYVIHSADFKLLRSSVSNTNFYNIILSNDKDMLQTLTKDLSTVLLKKSFKTKTTHVIDWTTMYSELVKSDYPNLVKSEDNFIADILSVAGDTVDCVEGVKGVGYKSIADLLELIPTRVSNIINSDLDTIKEANPEIKGRKLTTLKKLFEFKDEIELNLKQVDYDIIMTNIPYNTEKLIIEASQVKSDFSKFLKALKEIRSDFTTLLVNLFPDHVEEIESYFKNITSNSVYNPNSMEVRANETAAKVLFP